jgi:hypothetical protein
MVVAHQKHFHVDAGAVLWGCGYLLLCGLMIAGFVFEDEEKVAFLEGFLLPLLVLGLICCAGAPFLVRRYSLERRAAISIWSCYGYGVMIAFGGLLGRLLGKF